MATQDGTWYPCKGFQGEEILTTPSGSWKIEYVSGEWVRKDYHTTFRYTYAVTFLTGDGRRVEFTALDGKTRGEIISSAQWHERMGLATVTRS